MSITSAAHTSATEMELISSIVQSELLENTVILNSVTNHSDKVVDGIKSLEIPRFDASTTVGAGRFGDPLDVNVDGVTPTARLTAGFTTDKIDLNKHKVMPYRIPDRVAMQSRVALEAELARKAGQELAIYMDKEIKTLLDTLTVTQTYATGAMSISDIADARKALNKENVPQEGRVLLISPHQETAMLKIENFIHADKYGAREALLNGEIGKVFGFRVLVSNVLADDDSYAYHRECVGYAIQKNVDFETDRPDVSLKVTDYAYSVLWGCTMMYDGKKGVKFSV